MYFFSTLRRRVANAAKLVCLALPCANITPRRCVFFAVFLFCLAFGSMGILNTATSHLTREEMMEHRLAQMQAHIHFLESLYRARQEELITLENNMVGGKDHLVPYHTTMQQYDMPTLTLTPEVAAFLRTINGSRTASGLNAKNLQPLQTQFTYQLLPHLMGDPNSLRPAFHMKGNRNFASVVCGIPTVRRDKESYLMITLTHLVNGLSDIEKNSTLIVVFIGETDLLYVLETARQIETLFQRQVQNGLIEVLSPAASYYPDLGALAPTLGDSVKRFKWRTKQNLDTMYLMAYAQTRGTYYLMLEDDVIAKNDYIKEIKAFTTAVSIAKPQWFFIEFCPVGGIGKLFRSSDLLHFITYVQLFYNNLPIDWLLESYLADRVCTIDKASNLCGQSKLEIRPKYNKSLFLHIGLYSSLKGKMHKIQKSQMGTLPTYFPHENPALDRINCDITDHADQTIWKAYHGQDFFWGLEPKTGNVVEFWFKEPTQIERYLFRSGNVEHISDKFYDTVVEVLPLKGNGSFIQIGEFDEFGLADGRLKPELGPIKAIRLRVNAKSRHWVILSEIELTPFGKGEST